MIKILKLINNEKGSMPGMILMALVFFMFAGALVVDVGVLYLTKIQLQNAADAGALAGAMELDPTNATSDPVGIAERYARNNNTTGTMTAAATVTRPTITVVCSKTVPYFFARFFPGFSNQVVSAQAVARLVYDGGKSLPFVNLQDDYLASSEIGLWTDSEAGNFERVHASDCIITNPGTSVYFEINYQDGLTITNGVVNTIKQEVQNVFNRHDPYVYVLSLSSDVIRSGVVKMADGSIKALSKKNKGYPFIGNADVIARDQLVFLKCTFNVYDSSPHEAGLTFIEEYDIGHGEFPPNHLTARLVE